MNKTEEMVILHFPTQETRGVHICIAGTEYWIDGVPALIRDGQVYFSCQDWERCEYMVADYLVAKKICTGEAFKFIRKTLGMDIKMLARLLFHPEIFPDPEKSIKDWESGAVSVDMRVWEQLASLLRKGPRQMDPELTSAEAMAEVHEEEE